MLNKKILLIAVSIIVMALVAFMIYNHYYKELSEKDILRIAQNEMKKQESMGEEFYFSYDLKKDSDNNWSVSVRTLSIYHPDGGGIKGGEFSMTIDGSTGEILSFWIFP